MVLRCPYCLDDLLPEDVVVRCGSCRTPHHRACFRENEGCTSIGCDGEAEVEAGHSLYERPALRVGSLPTGEEVALGPFRLTFRRLATASRSPGSRLPRPWCRLSLEGVELREGESLRGRAVLHLPETTKVRQLSLRLTQGLRSPVPVAEVQLLTTRGWLEPALSLGAGSHPFQLELRAPPITPHVDPFQLELACTRGVLEDRLLSERLPLFLLQRPLGREADGGPPALRLPAPLAAAAPVQLPPPLPQPRLQPPVDPFHAVVLPHFDPYGADPFAPARQDGWRQLDQVSVRFVPTPAHSRLPLALLGPERVAGREILLTIAGGAPLQSLRLAVLVELVRPGGGAVQTPGGLPLAREVRLLGADGLEARRYGPEGIEVRHEVDAAQLDLLEKARAAGAHNAALRLHFSLDAVSADGRTRATASRAVTVLPRA